MKKVWLPQAASTNTWLLDALANMESIEEETVVYTLRQTQGRGQMGNSWESEADKNIAFSLLLKPTFLPVSHQFLISELCCLGVLDGLRSLCRRSGATPSCLDQLCIKWPNDIYLGDEKLGGILIENRLMGSLFADCVLGVGINVNQELWIGDAPNPTSLLLHDISVTPESVLDLVTEGIIKRYHELRDDHDAYCSRLHAEFVSHLYRREGWYPYVDAQSGESFDAALAGVDPHGPLQLRLTNGEIRSYWFKEVRFVLPCGITKE